MAHVRKSLAQNGFNDFCRKQHATIQQTKCGKKELLLKQYSVSYFIEIQRAASQF
jgi:hypothetical protein